MMFRIKLFVLSALFTLIVVGTAAAQAPGPTGTPDSGSNFWVFPAMGSFAVGIAARSATARR
jgi:hypothetical protein